MRKGGDINIFTGFKIGRQSIGRKPQTFDAGNIAAKLGTRTKTVLDTRAYTRHLNILMK